MPMSSLQPEANSSSATKHCERGADSAADDYRTSTAVALEGVQVRVIAGPRCEAARAIRRDEVAHHVAVGVEDTDAGHRTGADAFLPPRLAKQCVRRKDRRRPVVLAAQNRGLLRIGVILSLGHRLSSLIIFALSMSLVLLPSLHGDSDQSLSVGEASNPRSSAKPHQAANSEGFADGRSSPRLGHRELPPNSLISLMMRRR
jgi:hypothetical protein